MYSFMANYVWVMMEGLYLYAVIRHVFRPPPFLVYAVAGWTLPTLSLLPWLYVRLRHDKTQGCWIQFDNVNYMWSISGPLTLIILVTSSLSISPLPAHLCAAN